jgi:ferrochelatase
MRYGNPSLEAAMEQLTAAGCDRVLLVPLYPQYAAATTATACDKAFQVLSKLRRQPTLRVAEPFWEDPVYIDAVARSIDGRLAEIGFAPDVIVASFHGMPAATVAKGDPYYEQCVRTGEALRLRLGLPRGRLMVTFQSRFGREEWLKPYTDATVKGLGALGVKRIAVVNPGFSADCLETIEEIGVENAGYFLAEGGERFERIDCLNDSEGGMRVIESVVRRGLQGWV